ncbi:MAG: hypothetical protein J6C15_09080 [Bacteroidaceae bacterium]|nr:hypothetical protein [Bacteroidaceae bacterium]MBO5135287.1 hypothetical protein [Bacteroidaceae bacterium]
MKNFTLKRLGMLCVACLAGMALFAEIQPPQLKLETLTSGEKYVLFNKATPNGYMSRTSWDGALYFLSANDSHYADYQLEAVKNDDGTWMFKKDNIVPSLVDGTDSIASTDYMCIPSGSGNVNLRDYEAMWIIEEGDYEGYYKLKAGEYNNTSTIGLHMHLNAGQQYWVISYPGSGWYPDFEVMYDEEGNAVYDETLTYIQMADSTSLNWAFVKAESVTAYASFATAYDIISKYENAYLGVEGYEAGFQLTATAVEDMYNNVELTDSVISLIKAMTDAKVAFYGEIDAATALANESGDAELIAAVDAAMAVFNAEIAVDKLNAGKLAIMDAMAKHNQGLGDYTSLGVNMSFEDLTAQGGGTTTGVAAPPVGWNLILNGDTVTTIAEIQAHGVANWCGVNDDCAGEAKDGNYGFGIWTQGFPTVELSQTIEGIENGTYIVSAAMMVGANGNGSRRTTQRLFGNLNSTYFGSEYEYDLAILDNSEVYAFANLVEPVTDRDMQYMEVRAYVYDGKLTFGLRTDANLAAALRDASNSAGGDGWFKVDNFHITKVGYEADDALAVLNHYVNTINTFWYEDYLMSSEVAELVESKLNEFEGFTSSNTQEEINTAIFAAKDLLARMNTSVKLYAQLGEAITAAYDNFGLYSDFPGAGEYSDIITEVSDAYELGEYTDDQIPGIIAMLDEALENCKKSEILVGKDITYIIKNPSFEDQSSQPNGDSGGVADVPKGWNLLLDGDTCNLVKDIQAHGVVGWCAINSGDAISVTLDDGTYIDRQPTDGDKLWGIWNETVPEVELSQTLTGLPMGTYVLTADVMVQNNWAGDNITTQRIFANGYMQMFATEEAHALNLPEDAQALAQLDAEYPDLAVPFLTYAGYTCMTDDRTTDLLHTMTVTFDVHEDGIAHIGFRTNDVNTNGFSREVGDTDETGENTRGQGWFKVDNFTLYYDSEEVISSIKCFDVEDAATVSACEYYNVNGVRMATMQPGLNIIKQVMNNGTVKVSKVMVK